MSKLCIDIDRLTAFEHQFNPAYPTAGHFNILGYGKISTVFTIDGLDLVALKRLPPFPSSKARMLHEHAINSYHLILQKTIGLDLADQECISVTNHRGEYILYIVQVQQPADTIGDRLVKQCSETETVSIIETVLRHTLRVWHRNEIDKELDISGNITGFDARLSNWSITLNEGRVDRSIYLDTGTPFYRRLDKDQLDPFLYLNSIPASLARRLSKTYVQDHLDRYYDLRWVLLDFITEFSEIGQTKRIPLAIEVINRFLDTDASDLYIHPISELELNRFAKTKAHFWRQFLRNARLKRFFMAKVLRRTYQFSLPEKETGWKRSKQQYQ